jgi:hypothetical protein
MEAWMRRTLVLLLTLAAVSGCADRPAGPASGGGSSSGSAPSPIPSPDGPARVDLVEAGLRAVLGPHGEGTLFVMTRLCWTTMFREHEACDGELTDQEMDILAERLDRVADEIRFYPTYEDIPEGQQPIDGYRSVIAWVGPPEPQEDGSYWIEAGETCGGLCGHGSVYVLELRDGRWVSTGMAPGFGSWIS